MPAPLDTFPSSRNMQSDSQFVRGGASNLTLGLMAAGASGNGISIDSGVGGANGYSVGSFTHSNGIPMNASRLRRESMAHRDLAGSLTNKMSWGGKSVESWVMDEYVCPLDTFTVPTSLRFSCNIGLFDVCVTDLIVTVS